MTKVLSADHGYLNVSIKDEFVTVQRNGSCCAIIKMSDAASVISDSYAGFLVRKSVNEYVYIGDMGVIQFRSDEVITEFTGVNDGRGKCVPVASGKKFHYVLRQARPAVFERLSRETCRDSKLAHHEMSMVRDDYLEDENRYECKEDYINPHFYDMALTRRGRSMLSPHFDLEYLKPVSSVVEVESRVLFPSLHESIFFSSFDIAKTMMPRDPNEYIEIATGRHITRFAYACAKGQLMAINDMLYRVDMYDILGILRYVPLNKDVFSILLDRILYLKHPEELDFKAMVPPQGLEYYMHGRLYIHFISIFFWNHIPWEFTEMALRKLILPLDRDISERFVTEIMRTRTLNAKRAIEFLVESREILFHDKILICCCRCGYADSVRRLLTLGLSPNNTGKHGDDDQELPALCIALANCQALVVDVLLEDPRTKYTDPRVVITAMEVINTEMLYRFFSRVKFLDLTVSKNAPRAFVRQKLRWGHRFLCLSNLLRGNWLVVADNHDSTTATTRKFLKMLPRFPPELVLKLACLIYSITAAASIFPNNLNMVQELKSLLNLFPS